jgi:hypothetical protein
VIEIGRGRERQRKRERERGKRSVIVKGRGIKKRERIDKGREKKMGKESEK